MHTCTAPHYNVCAGQLSVAGIRGMTGCAKSCFCVLCSGGWHCGCCRHWARQTPELSVTGFSLATTTTQAHAEQTRLLKPSGINNPHQLCSCRKDQDAFSSPI